jgi:Di-haem oxidoreductase, putative peroxidase
MPPHQSCLRSPASSVAQRAQLRRLLGHTPGLTTRNSNVAALRDQSVHLHSDRALQQMGAHLGDDIQQGAAAGDEFRSTPLWGLGQRILFLHGECTSDLAQASRGDSKCAPPEAHAVLGLYKSLRPNDTQELRNFPRSL